jgi:hypothetical protein
VVGFIVLQGKVPHVLDGVFLHEKGPDADREEDTKGEPKRDEWDECRPVFVNDAFEHGFMMADE